MARIDPLISALAQRDKLDTEERTLLGALPFYQRKYGRGEEIVSVFSRPTHSCLVLSGITGRELFLKDGRRQVALLQVPGDFVDLHGLLLKQMDHSVVAMTDCETMFIPHTAVYNLIASAPHLGRLLWLLTLIDAAILRERVLSIGRRSAPQNLAHLICELYSRLETVGLVGEGRIELPLTQAQLADVLGLSMVHVNRSLKNLRNEGLLSWQQSSVEIPDFQRLAEFSDFDPIYLQLTPEPR